MFLSDLPAKVQSDFVERPEIHSFQAFLLKQTVLLQVDRRLSLYLYVLNVLLQVDSKTSLQTRINRYAVQPLLLVPKNLYFRKRRP